MNSPSRSQANSGETAGYTLNTNRRGSSKPPTLILLSRVALVTRLQISAVAGARADEGDLRDAATRLANECFEEIQEGKVDSRLIIQLGPGEPALQPASILTAERE